MTKIGYALSSEEHPPNDLVENAVRAEQAGFPFALISDHFHPWTPTQGQSPFVWATLGGIAHRTKTLRVGTGVTCPILRTHPVIVAHAAATIGAMMPGRFFLGLGTGENLNEHVVGLRWPAAHERIAMLEEAVEVICEVWRGGERSFHGRYYTVDRAEIFTLPDPLPEIYIAAKGEKAAALAARSDGLISTAPDPDLIEQFAKAGGNGKPRIGMAHVCWAKDQTQARKTAHQWWPNSSLKGDMTVELPSPRHFADAAKLVTEDDIADTLVCGPDIDAHVDLVRSYVDAGFDHIYVHQVGPDQAGFIDFYAEHVLPKFS